MILALFFTKGISLKTWKDAGLLDREKLIYEKHLEQKNFEKIYWFTYGTTDIRIANELKRKRALHKNIEVFDMPRIFNIPKLGSFIYSLFLPIYYRSVLKKVDVLKTNQMNGSWSALFAKWFYKKPLLLRTGFTQSLFFKKQKKNKIFIKFFRFVESKLYKNADIATVGSEDDKKYICSSYHINPNKIYVVHNYIDTNKFKNMYFPREDKLVFVGRLASQKNIDNLIKAVSETKYKLDIYGKGEEEKKLKELANKLNANVNFKGTVPNSELSKVLNKYRYFILPSYYEGMPKTLLEAMACGCICIGTNVVGINEVLEDGVNGYLITSTDSKAISSFLLQLPGKECEFEKISQNALNTIKNKFSLSSIVKKEYKLIQNIL